MGGCKRHLHGMHELLGHEMAEKSHVENRNSPHGRHQDVRGRPQWSGNLTALQDGDPLWNWPLTWPGVVNPALGPGKPNLIFVVLEGDLFVAKETLLNGLRKTLIRCARPSLPVGISASYARNTRGRWPTTLPH